MIIGRDRSAVMGRRLTLTEHQTTSAVRLTTEERDALRCLVPSIVVTPSPGRRGCYDVTPGSWVGTVRRGGLAIDVRPKIPIERVLFLVSYTLDPRRWHRAASDLVRLDHEAALHEAAAATFCALVRHAVHGGLLRRYKVTAAALPAVRGRLRLADQVRHHAGRVPPVEVEYDELTEDVTENRLLLAALSRLARLPLRSAALAGEVRYLAARFQHVSRIAVTGSRLPEVTYTRLNRRYRPATELARRLLDATSFELRRGSIEAMAFLLDMSRVFEEFIVAALRETLGLSAHTFAPAADRTGLALDEAGAIGLQPDLSWWEAGRCVFVGDVKYRRVAAPGVEHPDLYQLLAYVTAAGLPSGLLVYAAGEAEPVSHTVVYAGKQLHVASLDLAGSPDEILAQVEALATRVRRLRTGTR